MPGLFPSDPVSALLWSVTLASAQAQKFTSIDPPGSVFTFAGGINEQGDIVGRWDDADFNTHGFLLHRGVYKTLDYPGATSRRPSTSTFSAPSSGAG